MKVINLTKNDLNESLVNELQNRFPEAVIERFPKGRKRFSDIDDCTEYANYIAALLNDGDILIVDKNDLFFMILANRLINRKTLGFNDPEDPSIRLTHPQVFSDAFENQDFYILEGRTS